MSKDQNAPANIFLVGFMATGKSAVGRILSKRLNRRFVDADKEIERRAGKTIPDIFREDGEDEFRRLETSVVRDLCSGNGRIVAAGGGAFVTEENRRLMLEAGRVVCLTARPGTIMERLKIGTEMAARGKGGSPGSQRPMLAGDNPLERITMLLGQRSQYYALAHDAVATDDLTPAQVAQQVLDICDDRPGVQEE